MFKSMIKKAMRDFGKQNNYNTDYMLAIADSSTKLAIMYSKFVKLNGYRKLTPNDVMHVAKLATMKSEDCGPCLQLSIQFAIQSGIKKEIVEAAVKFPDKLPEDLKLVHDYALKVATNASDSADFQVQIEKRYGKDIEIELAMAIATSRVYPALKRGMGYAKSCSIMDFDFEG